MIYIFIQLISSLELDENLRCPQEIRNDHLDTEEGKKLIEKYDGEFPDRYLDEILNT